MPLAPPPFQQQPQLGLPLPQGAQPQPAQQPQPQAPGGGGGGGPAPLRDLLGEPLYSAVRATLMRQQSVFVMQLGELHKIARVQQVGRGGAGRGRAGRGRAGQGRAGQGRAGRGGAGRAEWVACRSSIAAWSERAGFPLQTFHT